MKNRMLLVLVAASLLGAMQAGAEEISVIDTPETTPDISIGETMYQSVCKNCHGPTARGMASFPKLVGQDAAYLVERLQTYRAGEKVGPNTPLMAPMAADLTDEEIASLAAYITTAFE